MAVVLEVTLGTLIGGMAACYGGWVGAILMRFTEAMLPSLVVPADCAGKVHWPQVGQVVIFGRTFRAASAS
jgi:ABC-type branched-subunit amino acid transport system permease subunit